MEGKEITDNKQTHGNVVISFHLRCNRKIEHKKNLAFLRNTKFEDKKWPKNQIKKTKTPSKI